MDARKSEATKKSEPTWVANLNDALKHIGGLATENSLLRNENALLRELLRKAEESKPERQPYPDPDPYTTDVTAVPYFKEGE